MHNSALTQQYILAVQNTKHYSSAQVLLYYIPPGIVLHSDGNVCQHD